MAPAFRGHRDASLEVLIATTIEPPQTINRPQAYLPFIIGTILSLNIVSRRNPDSGERTIRRPTEQAGSEWRTRLPLGT